MGPFLMGYRMKIDQALPMSRPNSLIPNSEFLAFVRPELERTLSQFDRAMESSSWAPAEGKCFRELLVSLFSEDVLKITTKTLVLEMHLMARNGELRGACPKTRFSDYIAKIGESATRFKIRTKYPELVRLVELVERRSLLFVMDVFHHFLKDSKKFEHNFGVKGILLGIQSTASDTHMGGKRVLFFDFDCGSRVVYKPRSLDLDIGFHQFLNWVKQRDSRFNLNGFSILKCTTYGWTEFIQHNDAKDTSGIRNFYYSFGVLQAVTYFLVGVDFHYENLVANGDRPVLIDLEGLLHARIDQLVGNRTEIEALPPVSQTGLMPIYLWGVDSETRVDISAIGHSGKGRPLIRRATWVDAGTDRMRIIKEEAVLVPGQNRPKLEGIEVAPGQYKDEVLKGFSDFYNFCLSHKNELLDLKTGPLAGMLSSNPRCILKPTIYYQKLLTNSVHPSLLRSEEGRRSYLNCVYADSPKLFGHLPDSEIADLMDFDIPIFHSSPKNQMIKDSRSQVVKNLKPGTAANQILSRLTEKMSEDDLQRNLWFITTSLKTIEKDELSDNYFKNRTVTLRSQNHASVLSVEAALQKVFSRLNQLYGPLNRGSFLTVTRGGGTKVIRTVPSGFYRGTSGILFALSKEHSDSSIYRSLLQVSQPNAKTIELLERMFEKYEQPAMTSQDISLAMGWSGAVAMAIRKKDDIAFINSLGSLLDLVDRPEDCIYGTYRDIEVCNLADGWAGVLWTLGIANNYLLNIGEILHVQGIV